MSYGPGWPFRPRKQPEKPRVRPGRSHTFLADTMAGILAKCEKAFDPSGRLAALSRRTGQEG